MNLGGNSGIMYSEYRGDTIESVAYRYQVPVEVARDAAEWIRKEYNYSPFMTMTSMAENVQWFYFDEEVEYDEEFYFELVFVVKEEIDARRSED